MSDIIYIFLTYLDQEVKVLTKIKEPITKSL